MTDRRDPEPAPDLVRGGVTVPGAERQRVECWSRVMGYLRPIRDLHGNVLWNSGKVSEYHDRKPFREVQQDRLEV